MLRTLNDALQSCVRLSVHGVVHRGLQRSAFHLSWFRFSPWCQRNPITTNPVLNTYELWKISLPHSVLSSRNVPLVILKHTMISSNTKPYVSQYARCSKMKLHVQNSWGSSRVAVFDGVHVGLFDRLEKWWSGNFLISSTTMLKCVQRIPTKMDNRWR